MKIPWRAMAQSSGKWVAGGMVVLGLIAALAALKWRRFEPERPRPTTQLTSEPQNR